jgi:hypothetical protein
MTIALSQQAIEDLCQEISEIKPFQHPDPDDPLDMVYQYPQAIGKGYWREIKL